MNAPLPRSRFGKTYGHNYDRIFQPEFRITEIAPLEIIEKIKEMFESSRVLDGDEVRVSAKLFSEAEEMIERYYGRDYKFHRENLW